MIGEYVSEMRNFPVYTAVIGGEEIALTQASVGGSSAAMQADFSLRAQVRTLFCCGSCGALDNIPAGDVIVPPTARCVQTVRHIFIFRRHALSISTPIWWRPPKVFFKKALRTVCQNRRMDHGGLYRETAEMVGYRKSEGLRRGRDGMRFARRAVPLPRYAFRSASVQR